MRSRARASMGWLLWMCCVSALSGGGGRARAEPLSHRIEGQVSVGVLLLREELMVARNFAGPMLDLSARYALWREGHAFELSAGLGSAAIWTRTSQRGRYLHSELAADYAECAHEGPRRALWVGALVRASHELAYLRSDGDSQAYWLDALMIGPSLRHVERLPAQLALELSADFSVMGVAARPRLQEKEQQLGSAQHFDRLATNPRWAGIGQTNLGRLRALLRFRPASARFGSGAALGLETRLSHVRRPKTYASWYLGIVLSFARIWPERGP